MTELITQAANGVSYESMDPLKREALRRARKTGRHLARLNLKELPESRGESAYLIEMPDHFLALVAEGLGTKNVVADAVPHQPPYPHHGPYYSIGQAVATVTMNDLAACGASPIAINLHLSVGDADWFADTCRWEDLLDGFRHACDRARCSWGGGETATLKGLVAPGRVVLGSAAIGLVKPKSRLIRCTIEPGDAIVTIASSGIHDNGLTLARLIAERRDPWWRKPLHTILPPWFPPTELRAGYHARLARLDLRSYGETLLDPTPSYAPLIESLLNAGAVIHYAVNITGHGWRKLMRAEAPFVYVVTQLPEPQPIFQFIQEHGPVEPKEMYGTFNMGAGFALIVPPGEVDRVLQRTKRQGFEAMRVGTVTQEGSRKAVELKPLGITFEERELAIR